jgi:hypothetical protein
MGAVELTCSPQLVVCRDIGNDWVEVVRLKEPVCVRYGSCALCGEPMQDDVPAEPKKQLGLF